MAKTSTTQVFSFFGREALNGGLNVSDNPLIIGPAEMTVAQNITIAQSLSRKKRPGMVDYHVGTFASTASYPTIAANTPILGISQYWRYLSATGVPSEDLFLHQGTKVWSIPDRINQAVDRTGSLALTAGSRISYQVFQGIIYFCSSTTGDGYNKWNALGATPGSATSATAPPDGPGKYLGIYNGRMVMGGNDDFPFRVYLSAALDAEDWVSVLADSLDLDYDGDPEGITAIFPQFQGRLFVATRRSIYEITGNNPSDFAVQAVTKGIGCIGANTVVATPNDILFCSDRGAHSLRKVITSDQTEVQFLSRPIQTLWTQLLTTSLLNQSQAVWDESQNLYIITVPSSGQTQNDTILCYNLNYGHWTLWEDVDARSLTNALINNKQYPLIGRENGRIGYLDPASSTDFGVGFASRFKTGKFFPGGDLTSEKRFLSMTILVATTQAASININWFIDSAESTKVGGKTLTVGTQADILGTTFVLGTSRLGQGRFVPITLSIEDVGYNIQFEFSSSGNSSLEFLGYILEVDNANPVYT